MKASCLCGKVRIQIGSLSGPFELCHCNRCKKHTGSAFNPVVDSSVEGFKILSGKENISTFKAPLLEAGPHYQVWFCSTCGSPLPDPAPVHEVVEIPAGIIDSEIAVTPDKSVFIEQSYSWLSLLSKIKCFTKSEIAAYRKSNGRKRYIEGQKV